VFSAQTVLKIFDYNLPYLEKIITVNPIIHWPHSITKIPFFVFLFEPQPVSVKSSTWRSDTKEIFERGKD